MKRREFVKISGATSLGMAALSGMVSCSSSMLYKKEYGLQIYTVRDAINEDFEDSMKRVADIGFTNIELFGYQDRKYFGKAIPEAKKLFSDLGLKIRSSHISLDNIKNNWQQVIDDAAELEQEYIVCPYLSDSERGSLDGYRELADLFNTKAEKAKSSGLQFAYHNHDFEFTSIENTIPYDLLLERCDNDLVKFEMDIYWVYFANQDPIAYFKKYPGRFPLWHVKDMTEDRFFAPVGQGTINWDKVFANAELAGLQYPFVEQDKSRNKQPFKNIEVSLKYLKENNL